MSRRNDTTFDKAGEICRNLWRELAAIDPKTGEERDGGRPDRAALAQLRRLGTNVHGDEEHLDTASAIALWPYRRLLQELRPIAGAQFAYRPEGDFEDAVVVVIATLAHVRKDSRPDDFVARRLGLGKDGQPVQGEEGARVMAEARFKRLIRTHAWPELLDQGRRIVRLLERNVPVADLAASLFLWNAGPRVRRVWSFDYYGADFASPESDSSAPPADIAPAIPAAN